jgi:pimeloyl-ACP methyl ester carboxylesterase
MRRALLSLLTVLSLVTMSARAAEAVDPAHCRGKLHKLDWLCQNLPRDWVLQLEHEPVFDGDVLTVQAGMEHAQTLVLVHGLGAEGFATWTPLIPELSKRYHVVTLDLPGFGYSDSPVSKYSPSNYAEVLDWLIRRHSHGPAIVVGHSLGGAVALRFAGAHPELLSKLVLVDAAGILERTAYMKQPAALPFVVADSPLYLKRPVAHLNDWHNQMLEYVMGLPDITRTLAADEDIWGILMIGHSNANAGMALQHEDFTRAIYALQVPTQIIWGEKDTVAPLRTGQMLARRLAQAELHVLPGAGHSPMEAPTDAAFLALLNEVLEQAPARAQHEVAAATSDLHCKGMVDQTYSGNYREVVIEDCAAVKLHDLNAQHMVIRNSIVELSNARIVGERTALEVVDSELLATAGEINGSTAIVADNARIDMAGFSLNAQGPAVEVKRSSRLIGSANEIRGADNVGYWQGNSILEQQALAPAP